jgi:CTP synthase
MQMAVVEFARSQAGLDGAGSSEFGTPEIPLVGLMTEWEKDGEVEKRGSSDDLGGTMRLGAYEAKLLEGTMAREIYDSETIFERHRHRYEVNMNYRKQLEEAGMTFSGVSPDGLLPEIVEIKDHPWFIGVQFHPELKSRPFDPHPLFAAFVAAAMKQSRLF